MTKTAAGIEAEKEIEKAEADHHKPHHEYLITSPLDMADLMNIQNLIYLRKMVFELY